MNDAISVSRRACDMAASAVFPASMVSSDYVIGDAGGEPYLMKCGANANKIILSLHTWSGDMNTIRTYPEFGGIDRACIVSPNFNGPNTTPQAMGSDDSLARINIVLQEVQCKTGLSRIYMVGASGGTMAALNYMGKYPGKIHRASLWLVIHDLATLYTTTQDQQLKDNMLSVIGHTPVNAQDPDYLARSPKSRLATTTGPTTVFLNIGATDISTPPSQGQAARDQLLTRPSFEVIYKEWPMGHVFDAPQRIEALKQMILE